MDHKQVELVDLNNKEAHQPVDYYYYTLYLPTEEILCIKNAGCQARLDSYLQERYGLKHWDSYKYVKTFYMGTTPKLDLDKVYKKYHKCFKNIETVGA